MGDDTFFRHFIIGAMLILGLCVLTLVGFIVIGLWDAGVGIFLFVIAILWVFGWIVHKLASSETVKNWLEDL